MVYRKKRMLRRRPTYASKSKKTKKCYVSPCIKKFVKYQLHINVENKTISERNRVAFSNWVTDPAEYVSQTNLS